LWAKAEYGQTLVSTRADAEIFASTTLERAGITRGTLFALGAYDALSNAIVEFVSDRPQDGAILVHNLARVLTQLETNSTYGAISKLWNQKIAAAFDYSSDTHFTAPAPISFTVAGGQIFGDMPPMVMFSTNGDARLAVRQAGDYLLRGGLGKDRFSFYGHSSQDGDVLKLSTGSSVVHVSNFSAGIDVIDLHTSPFQSIRLAPSETINATTSAQAWNMISAISGGGGGIAAGKVISGAEGHAWIYIDNSNGRVDSTQDMLIDISGYNGTVTAADFLFPGL
jgi:hypothetical protein